LQGRGTINTIENGLRFAMTRGMLAPVPPALLPGWNGNESAASE
jgi:hypothetical protein